LIGRKRFDEAERVLKTIYRINHKKEPKHIIINGNVLEKRNQSI